MTHDKTQKKRFQRTRTRVGRIRAENYGSGTSSDTRSQGTTRELNSGRRGRQRFQSRRRNKTSKGQSSSNNGNVVNGALGFATKYISHPHGEFESIPISAQNYNKFVNSIRRVQTKTGQEAPLNTFKNHEKRTIMTAFGRDKYGNYIEIASHFIVDKLQVYLTDVTNYSATNEGDTLLAFPLSVHMFRNSLVKRYASMYQRYKIMTLNMHYTHFAPATAGGGLLMAFLNDPLIGDETGSLPKLQRYYTAMDSGLSAIWCDADLSFSPGKGTEPKFIKYDDLGRWENYGWFYVLNAGGISQVNSETSRILGLVTCSSVVRFYDQLLVNPTDYKADFPAEITAGTPVTDVFVNPPAVGNIVLASQSHFPLTDSDIVAIYFNNTWLDGTTQAAKNYVFVDNDGPLPITQGTVLWLRRLVDPSSPSTTRKQNMFFRTPAATSYEDAMYWDDTYAPNTGALKYTLKYYDYTQDGN